MPSGKNWIYFLYVNIAFALYFAGVFYYSQVQEIKANWPEYQCNPIYMPLADNIEQNFTYCIQSMQSNFMGYLLQPLSFITGSLGTMMSGFTQDINNVRGMFNQVRTYFSSIISSVFGIFLNIIIEFQKIIIGIKDLIGKTIGIIVTIMYVMDGSFKTINSAWNGPPGQLVKSLGKCFHPDTKIKLKNGIIKNIKEIDLGDILENGSIVESVLKIDNKREPTPLYVIEKNGESNENIYVTGSHLVFDKKQNKFIKVENYENAKITLKKTEYFSCLITHDHQIKIGKELFWDWEDFLMKFIIYPKL